MAKKPKDAKTKKGKGAKASPAAAGAWPLISVAEHPRARRSIRRTKAWAGLLGLVLVAVLSHRAGVEPFEVGIRALLAGIGLYVVTWMVSVALWQKIVLYEAKNEAERRRDERAARLAALQAQQQAGDGDEAAVA